MLPFASFFPQPVEAFVDNFDRPNEPLSNSPNWTRANVGSTDLVVSGGRVFANGTGSAYYVGANQFSRTFATQAVLSKVTIAGRVGPVLLGYLTTASGSINIIGVRSTNDGLQLLITTGSGETFATETESIGGHSTGDLIRIEMRLLEKTFRVLRNGVVIYSAAIPAAMPLTSTRSGIAGIGASSSYYLDNYKSEAI